MNIKQLIKLTNSLGKDLICDGVQYFINSDNKVCAFCEDSNIVTANIMEGTEVISSFAFENCSKLTKVILNDGLETLEEHAFAWCISLSEIAIPNTVTKIGDGVFYECSNLRNVKIGDGVRSIGRYAFAWCSDLTEVVIPASVSNIGPIVFYECFRLRYVVLPKHFKIFRERAFDKKMILHIHWRYTKKNFKLCKVF